MIPPMGEKAPLLPQHTQPAGETTTNPGMSFGAKITVVLALAGTATYVAVRNYAAPHIPTSGNPSEPGYQLPDGIDREIVSFIPRSASIELAKAQIEGSILKKAIYLPPADSAAANKKL
jgi:hypothetical protein